MALTCTNVTLRQRVISNGRISLYLDYYPAIRNPYTMKMSRREYLGIYIYARPKNEIERDFNNEMLSKAEAIRCIRVQAIVNEEFGFLDKHKMKADFLAYLGLLAHFTQIYHLYNLLIYNILRRNLQLFITEFCIFSPCIIFISNKNSDKSIEILHISPKYITSVDNLMIHIFSSTFNFLYSFTPSDRLESKS